MIRSQLSQYAGAGVMGSYLQRNILTFWKHSPVGEEVNKLGVEYFATVLWIASDEGNSRVKPSKNNNNKM